MALESLHDLIVQLSLVLNCEYYVNIPFEYFEFRDRKHVHRCGTRLFRIGSFFYNAVHLVETKRRCSDELPRLFSVQCSVSTLGNAYV